MEVIFPSNGIIYFRSLDDPDNARGYTADGVVIDECAFVKKEAWYQTLRPMLIDTGGWAWGIGTPHGLNWFWDEHRKALDHTQNTSAWVVPTLGVRAVNGTLIREPNTLENPNISLEEIQNLYDTMPEKVFEQEILGLFVELSGSVFRRIQEAVKVEAITEAQPGRQYVAGVDVAASVDYTVITVIDVQAKNVVHIDRFNRVDYGVLEDRLVAVNDKFKLSSMAVETNSIGQPVIDALIQRNVPVIPFTTTSGTKQAAITFLQSAFEHGEIGIPDNQVLIGELLSFESKRSASGSFTYSAPDGMHDDCVMSLAIGWYTNFGRGRAGL
jgi:phage terminase large subunit-like protein